MSYGVALRNGIPFTLGTIAALCVNATSQAWSPAALWPTGTEAGMWIDPSALTSQWQDSTGTTSASPPGTVADSSNPVGLALDLRLGATALTDPGNHLFQATSTARPLLSARRNLLTYTEDFSAEWTKSGCTTPASALAPPAGYSGAVKYIKNSGGGLSETYRLRPCAADSNWSITAKKEEWRYLCMYVSELFGICYFDLEDGVIASETSGLNATIVSEGDGWYRCSIQHEYVGDSIVSFFGTTADGLLYPTGDGTSGISVTGAQVAYGLENVPYQAILTDGSSYSSTGFPIFQLYDGTDDGMATASFAAGTLTSAMDCMIAVRRGAAWNAVCGLYESVSDANKVFGIAESGSGSGCVGSGAGTPTVWVDGAQLTGGTAVTRGTLYTALSAGDWHILELRGLDLSTWTAAGSGLYTSYVLNGAQGGILLFPSSTPTADRDAARTWLGAKVGLTL